MQESHKSKQCEAYLFDLKRDHLAEAGEVAFAPEQARLAAGVADRIALSMPWAAGVKLPGI